MANPAEISDERPRLVAGVVIERTSDGNAFTCREPQGRTVTLRRVDALIAGSCNGARTLEELADFAQAHGSTATVEMVADVVRRLKHLGILIGPQATGPVDGLPSLDELPDHSRPGVAPQAGAVAAPLAARPATAPRAPSPSGPRLPAGAPPPPSHPPLPGPTPAAASR